MRMFLKALLNVIDKSTASKELLFNRMVVICNCVEKKPKFVTFHSLKAKMGREA